MKPAGAKQVGRATKATVAKPALAEGATRARRIPRARLASHAVEVHSRLLARYPNAHCALDYRSPLELTIATILSAQCTDKRVNMVTPALFTEFPTAQALADADPSRVEELIRSAGFFRAKTKSIIGMAQALVAEHRGDVPMTMDSLVRLPGVGRKTANVVLGNAFGINEGVVVDTHVARVSARLGLTSATDPVKIEQDLMPLFPRAEWTMLSHLFIEHGRTICIARAPKCAECPLNDICPSSRVAPGTISRAAPAVTPVKRRARASAGLSAPAASGRSTKRTGGRAAPAVSERRANASGGQSAPAASGRRAVTNAGQSAPSASARSRKSRVLAADDSRTSSPRPRRPDPPSR